MRCVVCGEETEKANIVKTETNSYLVCDFCVIVIHALVEGECHRKLQKGGY